MPSEPYISQPEPSFTPSRPQQSTPTKPNTKTTMSSPAATSINNTTVQNPSNPPNPPITLPRRISFTTPTPRRPSASRTLSKTTSATSSKASTLHRISSIYGSSKSTNASEFDKGVKTGKGKCMADVDKEGEKRVAEMHRAKARAGMGVKGVVGWVMGKIWGKE